MEGLGTNVRGLTEMETRVVIAGEGGIREINGNEKYIKQ